MRLVSRSLTPLWDLTLVLKALSCAPIMPLQQVELKMLSFKTALLLALTSTKYVSDIHALSVNSSCTQFFMGDLKVLLKPNPVFVPKVFNSPLSYCPIELSAFHPPLFSTLEQERLNVLDRTSGFRKSEQLFVFWTTSHLGKPLTRQRLSRWILVAIASAYHSTRGMAASWALFQGMSVEEICAAASWATPHTLSRFYNLDVTVPTWSHPVLSVSSVTNVPVWLTDWLVIGLWGKLIWQCGSCHIP